MPFMSNDFYSEKIIKIMDYKPNKRYWKGNIDFVNENEIKPSNLILKTFYEK